MRGCNVGSGQRRFETVPGVIEWTNVDVVSRPGQVPDVVAPGENMPFDADHFDYVVYHQVIEHAGCNEANDMLKEGHRVLKPGGSMLIFVPNLKPLAQKWLAGEISDYIYIVNLMGAYQGLESDRHRWHYTPTTLLKTIEVCGSWQRVGHFDWRVIPGADLARAFWVLAMEGVKKHVAEER